MSLNITAAVRAKFWARLGYPSNTLPSALDRAGDNGYQESSLDANGNAINAFKPVGTLGHFLVNNPNGASVSGAMSSAAAPTVIPTGGTATSWSYVIVAKASNLAQTIASAVGTTAAGVATLSATAYNTITWEAVANATSYDIYRVVAAGTPSTIGYIGNVLATATLSFVDYGITADGTIPPMTNTTGRLTTNGVFDLSVYGIAAPQGVVITNAGTAGSTAYSYIVTAVTNAGTEAPSTAASTSTGHATPGTTNYNIVTFKPSPGATSYNVYRSASSGTPAGVGLIGSVAASTASSLTFNDTGITATTPVPSRNNTGTVNYSGQFTAPPMLKTVTYNETLNASIGTTPFFIADQAYTVVGVNYVAKTAGSSNGTVTITKDSTTAVPGAGTVLLASTIAVNTTANTVTAGTLTSNVAALTLASGDRLSALFAGTLTTLAGVVITVTMTPTYASNTVQLFWRANGDIATQSFYTANRDMVVTGVKTIYGTAFAGAVTVDVTKDTGTTAAGAGSSILSAAMAGDGTINTVITPNLTATTSRLSMVAGDRLAVKFSATTTGALFCLVVTFAPIYGRKEVVWQLAPNAQQQVAQCFFIADNYYEVVDATFVGDVAAGGAAKIGVTIDKGTTVPGGGNVVQTDNTSAGFDANATARTVQYMTPASLHLRLMSPGDRLGLVVAGAAQSIADAEITVSLRPQY